MELLPTTERSNSYTEKIKGIQPFEGSIKPAELKDMQQDDTNTIKVVFMTGEQDGTVRTPTQEEQAEYESWCS